MDKISRLTYPDDAETRLRKEIAATHDYPERFVLFAYPWGEPGPLEHARPNKWQLRTLARIGKELRLQKYRPENPGQLDAVVQIAVASGHGIGKSALVSWIINWWLSTRVNPQAVITANTGEQLESKTWREVSLWTSRLINSHWFDITATKICQKENAATWFAKALKWSAENPEAFAGTHANHVLVIFDEASAIDDVIWETTEGALTSGECLWVCFGNPTRNTGRFRECFGRQRHRWITQQIDSREVEISNKEILNQWIEDHGEDSDFVKVRVRGVFPSSGDKQFIPTDLVEAAQERKYLPQDYQKAPIIVGVDPSYFGDDSSVILIRQGIHVHEIRRFREVDGIQLAGYVAQAIAEYRGDYCFVDANGIGASCVDQLKALRQEFIAVYNQAAAQDKHTYANKRVESWGLMREWLKIGSIPADNQLRDDLIGPEVGYTGKNQYILEPKEKMRKRGLSSPDNADALAITFAYPVGPKDEYAEDHRWTDYQYAQAGNGTQIGGY